MKGFLIIGNLNCVKYKGIFPLIKENKVWLGCSLNAVKCSFKVSEDYDSKNVYFDEHGVKLGKVNNAVWFTNIPNDEEKSMLELTKKYNPNNYKKYDNYDAIEVSRTKDIPMNYDGAMGVPLSFLTKYCPEQFEIIGHSSNVWVNGQNKYHRILIRRKI